MKYRIKYPKLLFASFLLMFLICGTIFYFKTNTYQELKSKGIITNATTTFIPKNYINYYKLVFETQDRRTITRVAKCYDENSFKMKYSELKVIYLLGKPEKFWSLSDFENYSLGHTLFFLFGVCGILITLITYRIFCIYKFLANKKNREELRRSFSGWRF
jgi:hypothetical protein